MSVPGTILLFFCGGGAAPSPAPPPACLNLSRSLKEKPANQFASDWPAKHLTLKHFTEKRTWTQTTLGDWFFSACFLLPVLLQRITTAKKTTKRILYIHTYIHTYIDAYIPYHTIPHVTLHYIALHYIHPFITLHYITLHADIQTDRQTVMYVKSDGDGSDGFSFLTIFYNFIYTLFYSFLFVFTFCYSFFNVFLLFTF